MHKYDEFPIRLLLTLVTSAYDFSIHTACGFYLKIHVDIPKSSDFIIGSSWVGVET